MGRVEEILDDLGLKPSDAVNMLFAQIERRGCLPFEVSLHHQPLMSATDQATEWTEALGEYSKGATASREGRGVNVEGRQSKVEGRRRNQQSV